jgi:hypothetical protein
VAVAILYSPLAAQNGEPSLRNNADVARVQHLVVRGTDDALEVEIQTSGAAVSPETQAISGPDRIIVDFPGALPAAELRALRINRGALKSVRAGLFFSNPPITRVVLDLAAPLSYQISSSQTSARNVVIVRLGSGATSPVATARRPVKASDNFGARLQDASLAPASMGVTPSVRIANAAAASIDSAQNAAADADEAKPASSEPASSEPAQPKPRVIVVFENGLLRIHAEKSTMAEVLYAVQRQTQAEIAIPAGAEQEQVAADLGPAPARDVLGALLNGSPYNFIFVGTEDKLERVILTRRDSGGF